MMGRQSGDQSRLFYLFNLEQHGAAIGSAARDARIGQGRKRPANDIDENGSGPVGTIL